MNKKIWDLYKNSKQGINAITAFTITKEVLENDKTIENKIMSIFPFCCKYLGNMPEDYLINSFFLAKESLLVNSISLNENETASEYFSRVIDNIEIGWVNVTNDRHYFRPKNEKPIVKRRDYKGICGFISEISLCLYFYEPNRFVPILFQERFDILMKILDILEIPMPKLPANKDKRGRLLFYNDLCENILQFAKSNDLTSEETCACIYDFALMLLEDANDANTELPEPTNIWLVGGSKEDYKTFLKNPVEGAISAWTCSANTKRGDIIVMYVRSPYSCIQSIWRANIDGVYTPFNYYNSRTEIAKGIIVPYITLDELKTDLHFAHLPIVRKNMQGVNGVQLSAINYKELQRMLTTKGLDVSTLPQLYSPALEFAEHLGNEKDVEKKLLIPLLYKLGYLQTDWTRQLVQKVGRKEKAIPDFVFFPKGEIHFQNAPMIIEAKYNMYSALERTKSYNQALSYARLMKSTTFGICDKDRLIIYKERNGVFSRFKPVFERHWQSLNDDEVFRQLKLLIGREALA